MKRRIITIACAIFFIAGVAWASSGAWWPSGRAGTISIGKDGHHLKSIWLTKTIVFEGDTNDAYEATLTVAEPLADVTITLPSASASSAFIMSTLTTNNIDVANSVWGTSNDITAEGATADAFEVAFTWEDPTTDNTITFPDYTGGVPVVVQQGYTQFSHSEATTVDVTGAALTLADGWFLEGKTFRIVAGGTVTGANGLIHVGLYFEDLLILDLATGSAAAGHWAADMTVIATAAATQRFIGSMVAGGGTDPVAVYAADTTDTGAAGTIPLKLQVGLAHADDTITVEYWRIEHSNKTD